MSKKTRQIVFTSLLVLSTILVSACGAGLGSEPADLPDDTVSATAVPPSNDNGSDGDKADQPFAPQEGDQELERGEVRIEEMQLMIMESWPVQISLHLEGNLPTPCHQLRVKVSKADEEGKVHIEVYSVADPEKMCAQALEPFEENIPLGSYKEEGVSFWMNGEKVGEY